MSLILKHQLLSAAAAVIACSAATFAIAQTSDTSGLLRDNIGKTLYIFDKDSANESKCFEGCAVAWPPFMAAEGAKAGGKLTLIARKGASAMQWAWDGKPLYYFAGDAQAGEVSGDGSGGVWHVVKTGEKRADTKPAVRNDPYRY